MEYKRNHQRTFSLYSFLEEDSNTSHSSSSLNSYDKSHSKIHENLLYSPSTFSTESPWTLSPHNTPSPSLLYHCIASLHRQDGTIFSIATSKGLIFTGTESNCIRAWRQQDFTEHGTINSRYGEVRAILAHEDTLFTSHKDNQVRKWSISPLCEKFQGRKLITLPKRVRFSFFRKASSFHKHKDRISCMAFNHTEGILYTGSFDRTVKAWLVSSGFCFDSFIAHEDKINDILVNKNDGCLFTCSTDGLVKIWRRVYGQSSHNLTITLKFQNSPVNALALSTMPTSCFLYSACSDGVISLWEKEKMSVRFNHGGLLQGHVFGVLCVVAKENFVFSGSEDMTIRIWRREEGSCFHECLVVIDAHRGPVKCLAVSVEIERAVVKGFLVHSAGFDQTFKVWRINVSQEEMECNSSMCKRMKNTEYEISSPVLSPSWVKKKLEGDGCINR